MTISFRRLNMCGNFADLDKGLNHPMSTCYFLARMHLCFISGASLSTFMLLTYLCCICYIYTICAISRESKCIFKWII